MLIRLFAVLLIAVISGCGVAYVPSSVHRNSDYVRVIPLDFESVLIANRSTYSPKQLPSVFYRAAAEQKGLSISTHPSSRPQLRVPPNVDPGPYRIGVGDVLAATDASPVIIEDTPELTSKTNLYRVQQDGTISVPEVGRVSVAGLTTDAAETALFQRLIEGQTNPNVSLQIEEYGSQSVSVGGAILQPIIIPVTETPLYLDKVLSAAGIDTVEPEYTVIRIFRNDVRYQIPLEDYLTRPALQKVRMIDGDSVFVDIEYTTATTASEASIEQIRHNLDANANRDERTSFEQRARLDAVDRDYVYLTGEVARQGRFELPFERQATLADALYSEGGYRNETANPSQIYVLRGSPDPADFGAVTAWHLNARDASNFVVATRMQMRPNDVIFIAEQPVTKWNRVVQQLTPSLILYGANQAVTQ